jgi:hypothetical protein
MRNAAPFFLTITPFASHSDFQLDINVSSDPPPSFNLDVPSGVDWVARMPLFTSENITCNDHLYCQRFRALQAVDAIVEDVIKTLEEHNILNNTYIFYSSDSAFHIDQHRLPPRKGCGFEKDINVPLIVHGRGVPAGKVITHPTSHTDLAPTWWTIRGIPLRGSFDASPMPLTETGINELQQASNARGHVQVQF